MTTYRVFSTKYNIKYDLIILNEKGINKYHWCNLSKGHICPRVFSSIEEAEEDLKRYETDGKIIILGGTNNVLNN